MKAIDPNHMVTVGANDVRSLRTPRWDIFRDVPHQRRLDNTTIVPPCGGIVGCAQAKKAFTAAPASACI